MTIHLYAGDATTGLVRAFCGWRVAVRHTTDTWHAVTCALCQGRRAGLAVQAVRPRADARRLTDDSQHPTTSSTSLSKDLT